MSDTLSFQHFCDIPVTYVVTGLSIPRDLAAHIKKNLRFKPGRESARRVVVLMLSASYRLMSPAGGTVCGDCGTFRMYTLVGDSSSLEVRPKALEAGLTSCLFFAS